MEKRKFPDYSYFPSILYWRNLAAAKFADRPYFVTETNHCIPNPYSYEFGLVMGAYSAFQGFP